MQRKTCANSQFRTLAAEEDVGRKSEFDEGLSALHEPDEFKTQTN
jgi:hypothetical protein